MESFVYKKVSLSETSLMDQIYRLRFKVYCRECGFIKEEDYPQEKENDEYDSQSVHFAAVNNEGDVIGTIRLILPGLRKLPVQKHCPDLQIGDSSLPQVKFAEISRLVISKKLRRRKNDGSYYEPVFSDEESNANSNEFLRRTKPMAFGLYRELYRESKQLGITHWYTLMEKSLWLLLHLHGFSFSCIGPEVDVYGPVCPYLGKLEIIEEEVKKKFPKFFDYFSQDIKSINP